MTARSRSTSAGAADVDDYLSTEEMAWVLDTSAETIRERIRDGEIQGVRLPAGFRIPRAEALRLARERIEAEAGRKLSEQHLEKLIDEVITTNKLRG
jgi:excisionase family DNA binding protein